MTAAKYEELLLIFAAIIYEALPFIVLGVVIAGLLEEFIPQQWISRIFRGRLLSSLPARAAAIALGGVLGLIFPMCECGIVPIMQRLLRKGVPVGVCVSYMLAGPIINVVVISATFVAFNPPKSEDFLFPLTVTINGREVNLGGPVAVAGLRVGLGFIVACVAAAVVEWQYRKHGNKLFTPALLGTGSANDEAAAAPPVRRSLWQRLGNISETALHDFVDILAFLVIGAALAAVVRTFLQDSGFSNLVSTTPPVAILLLMALAVAICLCSEADAFVASAFPLAWPPAAKIAFLVLGPMLDFKLFLMYTRVFRQRLIWTIMISVVVQVFGFSLLLLFLWPAHGYRRAFQARRFACACRAAPA
jgi:uncharacterized membrane protein YraQ (UPF0718 family)